MTKCECLCGGEVEPGNRFILGHNPQKYDKVMKEKCKQAALLQHENMTEKEKEERCSNLSKGYKKAKSEGKKMGHFTPHTKESNELNRQAHLGKIPWNKDKTGVQIVSEPTRQLLREATIQHFRKTKGIKYPCTGIHETSTLDAIEKCIQPYGIIRQFKVAGFFVDGYCPALNTVYEIDESFHFDINGNLSEYDIRRQKIIEEELNCNFFRIKI